MSERGKPITFTFGKNFRLPGEESQEDVDFSEIVKKAVAEGMKNFIPTSSPSAIIGTPDVSLVGGNH